MEKFEKDIPWWWWKSIWVIWYDMASDGTREYVKKMFRPDKIDQVLTFYGIPFIYKNEYRRYLKYRIQPRHYQIVQDYFYGVLSLEWYDVSDFNFWELQEEYNQRVPVAEGTWLEFKINYDDFLAKDKQHRDAIEKQNNIQNNEVMQWMLEMMQNMQKQMDMLQSKIWDPKVLLSNSNDNGWNEPSWSDSTRNATDEQSVESISDLNSTTTWDQETPIQTDGEAWKVNEEEQWRMIDREWSKWLQWTSKEAQWIELTWVGWNDHDSFWLITGNSWDTKKDRRNW